MKLWVMVRKKKHLYDEEMCGKQTADLNGGRAAGRRLRLVSISQASVLSGRR